MIRNVISLQILSILQRLLQATARKGHERRPIPQISLNPSLRQHQSLQQSPRNIHSPFLPFALPLKSFHNKAMADLITYRSCH